MTKADIPDEEYEVWPDNWPAFLLFEAMSTQWRVGMGGAVGLDYNAIKPVASMIGLKRAELGQAFPDLRMMEAEALLVMSESRT
ncbi:DUF1799 domain-containing protein [Pseudomonas sp. WS 5111]|uniref:DUF1799 domain-containing protein n=1 Tax=Pseudomonas sp. WS 5111 TaxID=2717493 RepID=UPI001472FBBB|nr:DUF1799 domain-containing protein [Pseudomonas sp. WS 5111]NMX70915.1 DUF1799 domain-containing protein [Pseudomonas sp. WS 5111]